MVFFVFLIFPFSRLCRSFSLVVDDSLVISRGFGLFARYGVCLDGALFMRVRARASSLKGN